MSSKDKQLLCNIGLPSSVAPFLNFENYNKDMILLSSRYENGKRNKELKESICLGFDGYGNYLCLNLTTGAIKLYEHELLKYKKGYEVKLNNSVEQFF